jgi:sulfur-oxidizing protein SoxX
MKKMFALFAAFPLILASVAHAGPADEVSPVARARAVEAMKRDFQAKGIAGEDRLVQDGLQAICNRTGNNPPEYMAKQIEADQLATVKFPADGKLMGDWKAGESLAQSGRGMTWSDNAGIPNGGNCYNCHQISPQELSYGTIGPTLKGFGKLRGNSPEIQKYVYSKISNAKAFNACSDMPRFGQSGALTEKQIKDLVALLLDPASPTNK